MLITVEIDIKTINGLYCKSSCPGIGYRRGAFGYEKNGKFCKLFRKALTFTKTKEGNRRVVRCEACKQAPRK